MPGALAQQQATTIIDNAPEHEGIDAATTSNIDLDSSTVRNNYARSNEDGGGGQTSSPERRNSYTALEEEQEHRTPLLSLTATETSHNASKQSEKKSKIIVSWRDLPQKPQLAILTIARLSEPLVQTSIQSYMFYQLKSFGPDLPDSTIATQAGILQASFTAAQFLTAMIWGRVADSDKFGRKFVILVGLFGTMLYCVGYGFAKTFWQAALFRAIGGGLNGNVGVMRTMISEIIREKKYQSRAFLLLPMCFNIGVIIGPVMGGLLADPAGSYPNLFGGWKWLEEYPYAPPNLLSGLFLLVATLAVWLGLQETLPSLQHKKDIGSRCGSHLASCWRKLRGRTTDSNHEYTFLSNDEQISVRSSTQEDLEMSASAPPSKKRHEKALPKYTQRLPFRRIFTPNVIFTLIAWGFLACHISTFNALWFVFLSTPVSNPAKPYPGSLPQKLPFIFTGGLGMPPLHVGTAMAILGVIGITMQLLIYPTVSARLGTLKSWRLFLICFPLVYAIVPFLSLVPSRSPPPHEKDGPRIWLALLAVLFVQVIGRTFALPGATILVNNCVPHPSVLGTVHGLGQSVSAGMRTVGPFVGGAVYGLGLRKGVVGVVWWGLSLVAVGCIVAGAWVRDGDGHEIWLEGDEVEEGM